LTRWGSLLEGRKLVRRLSLKKARRKEKKRVREPGNHVLPCKKFSSCFEGKDPEVENYRKGRIAFSQAASPTIIIRGRRGKEEKR